MTDEKEFAARSQLKWARDGDAWILLYRRRRMGRVVPDKDHSGMWRSVKVDGILSNTANLSRSKDNVMAQAIREIAWDAANDPQKWVLRKPSKISQSESESFRGFLTCSPASTIERSWSWRSGRGRQGSRSGWPSICRSPPLSASRARCGCQSPSRNRACAAHQWRALRFRAH